MGLVCTATPLLPDEIRIRESPITSSHPDLSPLSAVTWGRLTLVASPLYIRFPSFAS